jgi:hypothetical protein
MQCDSRIVSVRLFPAIANAIKHATGVRFTSLPFTAARIYSQLANGVELADRIELTTRGWKEDPDTLPWLKQRASSDEDRDVRWAAMQELAPGWKEDPDTLPILK